jgi:hypothetical protein
VRDVAASSVSPFPSFSFVFLGYQRCKHVFTCFLVSSTYEYCIPTLPNAALASPSFVEFRFDSTIRFVENFLCPADSHSVNVLNYAWFHWPPVCEAEPVQNLLGDRPGSIRQNGKVLAQTSQRKTLAL